MNNAITPESVRQTYTVESDTIRTPGKFESEHFSAPYFYDATLDGCSESLDWMEDGCGTCAELLSIEADERAQWELDEDANFVVVAEDSQGFVTLHFYATEDEARKEWEREPAPEDDDVTTEDHHNFYQWGKLVLSINEDDDMGASLRAWMEREKFWPTVWFISDHGNASIVEL